MEAALFTSFSNELQKLATLPVPDPSTAQLAGKLVKKIPGKHLLSAATGAALLYGGHRLVKDIQMGEELRKQQKQEY